MLFLGRSLEDSYNKRVKETKEDANGYIEKILEKILQDQLERRFGKLPAVTTTQTTTIMVETTTRSASIENTSHTKTLEVKVCEFKNFEACTLDEWNTFLRHVLKNQRHSI